MKIAELQNNSPEALQAKLIELQQKYYAMRETVRSGKQSNHAQLKGVRRDIARVQTMLNRPNLA